MIEIIFVTFNDFKEEILLVRVMLQHFFSCNVQLIRFLAFILTLFELKGQRLIIFWVRALKVFNKIH